MSLGPWEILLIVLVIFLLFGATRLPNAARSLGRSMRIFKSEMDEMKNDKKANDPASPQATIQGGSTGVQAQDVNQQAQPQTDPLAQPDNVQRPDNGTN